MRGRPGRIQQVIDVPFQRPREYSVVTSSTFGELKHELLMHLKAYSAGPAASDRPGFQ